MKDVVKKEGSRHGFGIEAVLLTAVFVIVCTVLFEGFSACLKKSRNAADLQNSTDICRNAAELYLFSGSLEKTAGALDAAYEKDLIKVNYDKSLSICDENDKVYTLVITERKSDVKGVSKALFSVYRGDTLVYSLETGAAVSTESGGAK